jgi:MATE family multidrug resistance protein
MKADAYPLLRLAIPLALTGLAQSASFFFTTIFLAHLGPKILAAGSLVSWLFATLVIVLFGTLSSINVLVSHKHGAKDQEGIALIARDGLLLAALLAIPGFLLLWNMAPIFLLFGQPESVVLIAKPYLHALSWGLLASFLTMACLEVTIGIGLARIALVYSIVAVTLNIFFNYVLIFGKFGFPALGIDGAGWGFTVECWVTLIMLGAYIALNKKLRPYFCNIFTLKKSVFLVELLRVGLPIGVMYCFEVAFFFALTLSMGILGTVTQAANQVALQYLCLMMSIIFSIAQAITVRMGHLLGEKETALAKNASHIGIFIVIIFMSLVACVYWIFPSFLISLDFNIHNSVNYEIIREIKPLLAICALFQIVEATRIALFGSLRALKDTRFTMLASIISFWCIALPVGFFLAIYWHLGGTGFWWGMVMGAAVSVTLLYKRFQSRIKRYYRPTMRFH